MGHPLTGEYVASELLAVGQRLRRARRVAVAVVAALAVALVAIWGTIQATERAVWRTREIARLARAASMRASERQAALRGYMLSRDTAFIGRDAATRAALVATLDSLVDRTQGSPGQRVGAVAFRDAVRSWDAGYAATLLATPPADLAAATASLTASDEARFPAIRRAGDRFLAAEDARYARRVSVARRATFTMLVIVVAGIASLFALIRTVHARATRQARQLLAQQQRLTEQAAELEVQLSQLQALTTELEESNQDLRESLASQQALGEQLTHAQKLEAVARLAGGVAHDFSNLLTIILSYSSLATRLLPADHPVREHLAEIEASGRRGAGLTSQLLAFSRKQVVHPEVLDVAEVIAAAVRMLRPVIGADVELRTACDDALPPVRVDRGQLDQVLMNLVINARDAMPSGGRITISASTADLPVAPATGSLGLVPGRYVAIRVSDTGAGIAPDIVAKIFDPFFTTKPAGRGTGLGLSTVHGIVRQAGGAIGVESVPGRGTTFTVYLPPTQDAGVVVAPPALPPVQARHGETILFAEDDAALRALGARVLRDAGFTVITAANGIEALEAARAHTGRIHLIATDVVMPMVGGATLVRELLKAHAEARVLIISGYVADEWWQQQAELSGYAVLPKPFAPEELLARVAEVLGGHAVSAGS